MKKAQAFNAWASLNREVFVWETKEPKPLDILVADG
jgi:hypothetical protein